jgi:hypothetical protein
VTLPPGTEIAAFRIERVLGSGPAAVVYEATQVDLARRVALKVFTAPDERLYGMRWPEHPNIVRLYAAGTSEVGQFLALQLVDGPTLAELSSRKSRRRAAAALRGVGAALDAAHRAGHIHGKVVARKVFVDRDGRGLLSDFGLGPAGATARGDRVAFAELVRACGGRMPADPVPPSAEEVAARAFPSRPRRRIALAAIGIVAAGAAAIVLLRSQSHAAEPPPPVLAGAVALGSSLRSASVDSVDCSAARPTGASQACTIAQTVLGSGAVTPGQAGVVRRWAVRGARGELALAVMRARGRDFYLVARTPYANIPDEELHVLTANLPVRQGDLIGVIVTPGAAVGIRRGVRSARTARWFGPLVYSVRPPERGPGTGFDHEILLRVEYSPRATWRERGALVGTAAAAAPAGRVAGSFVVQRAPSPATLVVARVGNAVVVDLVAAGRRLVRLPLPGGGPKGQLTSIEFRRFRFGKTIVQVRWRNPASIAAHDYVVDARSLTLLG